MLVYGDPSFTEELGVLVARLQLGVTELADAQAPLTLERLRALLIEAGQVEQATQDAQALFPGGEASEAVRAWWGQPPRFVVPPAALRWGGQSLTEHLAAQTQAMIGGDAQGTRVEDFGGGLWRRVPTLRAKPPKIGKHVTAPRLTAPGGWPRTSGCARSRAYCSRPTAGEGMMPTILWWVVSRCFGMWRGLWWNGD